MRRQPRTTRRRGIALVAVLWVVLLAAVILAGVQKAARVQLALGHAELGAVQAHWLARAGVERAMATLEDDHNGADHDGDKWYRDDGLFRDVQLGEGSFSVLAREGGGDRAGLSDEASRVSLNAADRKQLLELPEMNEARADALLDWRSRRDASQPVSAGAGYYQGLRLPYDLRSGPLQTHRELLQVKGFEDGRFFGERSELLAPAGPAAFTSVFGYEPNRDGAGAARIDLSAATAEQLQERLKFSPALAQAVVQARGGQFDSVFKLLDVRAQGQQGGRGRPAPPGGASGASGGTSGGTSGGGSGGSSGGSEGEQVSQVTLKWLAKHFDELTVSNDERLPARVNINTAPREVLLTLPEMTGDLADSIISRRTASGGPFYGVGELLEGRVLDEKQFRAMAERMTTRSSVFTVESVGSAPGGSGIRRRILAVIDRGSQTMKVLYWYQSE